MNTNKIVKQACQKLIIQIYINVKQYVGTVCHSIDWQIIGFTDDITINVNWHTLSELVDCIAVNFSNIRSRFK